MNGKDEEEKYQAFLSDYGMSTEFIRLYLFDKVHILREKYCDDKDERLRDLDETKFEDIDICKLSEDVCGKN